MTGPKAYVARATFQDDQHLGSTSLHMDMTSTINLMSWTANCADGTPGYAIWHIFLTHHSQILHEFLIQHAGFQGEGDPIHSQTMCMTPTLLDLLYAKYQIRPYMIQQYAKQAVYIPAGCAHQVRNCFSISKLCIDYVR